MADLSIILQFFNISMAAMVTIPMITVAKLTVAMATLVTVALATVAMKMVSMDTDSIWLSLYLKNISIVAEFNLMCKRQ